MASTHPTDSRVHIGDTTGCLACDDDFHAVENLSEVWKSCKTFPDLIKRHIHAIEGNLTESLFPGLILKNESLPSGKV